MRRVVSLFLPNLVHGPAEKDIGDAAPSAEAPLVLTACENRSRRPRATIHKFRLERSITPDSKTASRDPVGAVRKLRTTDCHHDLPVARKAEVEKSNLDEEVRSPQA
jgi:hypothetical protein